jgi:lipopolysaccharide/colanic/teichoic acid biosynthesis glycosyltransferase
LELFGVSAATMIVVQGMVSPTQILQQFLLLGFLLSVAACLAAFASLYRDTERRIGVVGISSDLLREIPGRVDRVAEPEAGICDKYDILIVRPSEVYLRGWAQPLLAAAISGCEVRTFAKYIEERDRRIPLMGVPEILEELSAPQGSYVIVKRLADVVCVLLLALPALCLAAAAIALIAVTSGRPFLFVQDRVGLNGRVFRLYKLRTMINSQNSMVQIATATVDDRITPLGKLLRRFHIDELPQLWNVVRNDMTLIGPRPEQPDLVAEYMRSIPYYGMRHQVKPGISGWSQVRYGYASTTTETQRKLEFDLFYLRHFGPLLDLEILARTFASLFDPSLVR